MINSTYSPNTWAEIEASKVVFGSFGIAATAGADATTNLDYILTQDVFVRSIEVIARNAGFGDKITMTIIDNTGITGAPPGTIIAYIVNDYNVSVDNSKFLTYNSAVPKKALATMTIRLSYTVASLSTAVDVAINYISLRPII